MASIQLRAAELCPGDFNFNSRREIGSGGKARVFRVLYSGKEVAVKVPHWEDSSSEAEVSSRAVVDDPHRHLETSDMHDLNETALCDKVLYLGNCMSPQYARKVLSGSIDAGAFKLSHKVTSYTHSKADFLRILARCCSHTKMTATGC